MSTSLTYSLSSPEEAVAPYASGETNCGDNPGYGNLYGGLYGGCPSTFESLIISRLLMFTRQDYNLPMFTRLFSTRTEVNINFASELAQSFDIATAEGHRLDIIGTILQVPRFGLNDSKYRRRLQIQIDTLLTSGGTTAAVLSVIETWTGIDTDIYVELYPAGFVVSAQVEEEEFDYLADMIELAKPGGVAAHIVMAPAGALVCDDVTDSIADIGTMDDVTATLSSAGPMGMVYSL